MSKEIRDFYFGDKAVNEDTLDKMNMLMSDINYLYGIYLSARIQAAKSKGKTFFSKSVLNSVGCIHVLTHCKVHSFFFPFFRFSVENEWNFSWRQAEQSGFKAEYSAHGDQLYYVFRFIDPTNTFPDEAYQTLKENSVQWQIIKNITNFYANFAKFK